MHAEHRFSLLVLVRLVSLARDLVRIATGTALKKKDTQKERALSA
jgi:hypothetical protein